MIDEIVDDWLQQLEKRKEVEFGAWGTYIAMDVREFSTRPPPVGWNILTLLFQVTKISLDNQMGFIEKGGDVNNYYASLNVASLQFTSFFCNG